MTYDIVLSLQRPLPELSLYKYLARSPKPKTACHAKWQYVAAEASPLGYDYPDREGGVCVAGAGTPT